MSVKSFFFLLLFLVVGKLLRVLVFIAMHCEPTTIKEVTNRGFLSMPQICRTCLTSKI